MIFKVPFPAITFITNYYHSEEFKKLVEFKYYGEDYVDEEITAEQFNTLR